MLFISVLSSDTVQNSCPQRSQAVLGMVLSIALTRGNKGQVYSQQPYLWLPLPQAGEATPDPSLITLNFSKSIILSPFYS